MLRKLKENIYDFIKILRFTFGYAKRYKTGNEKNFALKFFELLIWYIKNREFNSNYYGFGLNIKKTQQRHFISRKEFFNLQTRIGNELRNTAGCLNINYDVLTKDKFVATAFLSANKIPCIKNIGLWTNKVIINHDGTIADPEEYLLNLQFPIIIKNTVLEYNEGFIKCAKIDGKFMSNGKITNITKFIDKINACKWVIQEVQANCGDISAINNTALNTIRIVTILNGLEPIFLTGFHAFATNGNITDSWGKGSIYVGINPEESCLKKYGFYHPNVGEISYVEEHPDSKVVFKNYKIKDLNEAIKICLNAHRLLYFHFAIGWDVAMTENGPMILEANEKPGMNAVQYIDGGLRREIMQCANQTIKNIRNKS